MILEERTTPCPALTFRYVNRIKELRRQKELDPANACVYEHHIKIAKWMLNCEYGPL